MARTDIPGVVDLVSGVKHPFDAWQNALTGLGTALRDKLQSTTFRAEANLSDEMVENLYHQEDMAARIVEALPEGALRRGYSLVVEGEEASDIPSDLFEYEKRLGFRKALKDAAIWGRCFGGAAIYLGIDDGQLSEEEPVNEDAIRSLDFALVLTKRELTPNSYYETADEGKLGMPETYRLSTIDGRQADGSDVIHETRLLRFDGARTSTRRRRRNNGWSDSVLQKVHGVLVQFNVGWASTSHILQDGSQGVFKIRGLIDMIADGDKETLNSRMELVNLNGVELVGIVKGELDQFALLEDEKGFSYILRVGDGVRNGHIVSISDHAMVARVTTFGRTSKFTLHLVQRQQGAKR